VNEALTEAFAAWENGELSRSELLSRFGDRAAPVIELHARMMALSDLPVPAGHVGWANVARRLAPRRPSAWARFGLWIRRPLALGIAGAAVTGSVAFANPGVRHQVGAIWEHLHHGTHANLVHGSVRPAAQAAESSARRTRYHQATAAGTLDRPFRHQHRSRSTASHDRGMAASSPRSGAVFSAGSAGHGSSGTGESVAGSTGSGRGSPPATGSTDKEGSDGTSMSTEGSDDHSGSSDSGSGDEGSGSQGSGDDGSGSQGSGSQGSGSQGSGSQGSGSQGSGSQGSSDEGSGSQGSSDEGSDGGDSKDTTGGSGSGHGSDGQDSSGSGQKASDPKKAAGSNQSGQDS
jgi:hypothetical protein